MVHPITFIKSLFNCVIPKISRLFDCRHIQLILQVLYIVCFQPLKHYYTKAVDNAVKMGDVQFKRVKFGLMFSQFGSNPLKSRRYFHLFAKQASFHIIVRLFLIDFRLRLRTLHLIQHNLLLPYLIVQFRRCASLYRLLSAILHISIPKQLFNKKTGQYTQVVIFQKYNNYLYQTCYHIVSKFSSEEQHPETPSSHKSMYLF